MAMKYPFILMSFAISVCLFFYPTVKLKYPLDVLIIFISFYSITFFLVLMDEKKKDFTKDTREDNLDTSDSLYSYTFSFYHRA